MSHVLKSRELEQFATKASYDSTESVLAAIGYGKFSPQQIVALFVPHERMHPEEKARHEESVIGRIVRRLKRPKGMVKVGGMSDMMLHFAKCCNPVPGDPIVGFVTRGRGVTVHVADCEKVIGQDTERLINVEWDMTNAASRIARIRVVCSDRPGMLAKMTEAISEQGSNIAGASIRINDDKTATNSFDVEIKDLAQLRAVMKALERVKGIISVARVRE